MKGVLRYGVGEVTLMVERRSKMDSTFWENSERWLVRVLRLWARQRMASLRWSVVVFLVLCSVMVGRLD